MGLKSFLAARGVRAAVDEAQKLLADGSSAAAAQAVEIAREACRTAEILPQRDRDRRTAALVLGHALSRTAPEEALSHSREIGEGVHGTDTADDLDAATLNNWASVLSQQGDHAGALPLYEAAIAIKRRLLGDLTPEILGNLEDLRHCADQLRDVRREYWASKMIHEVIGKLVGPDHPEYVKASENLAIAARQLDEPGYDAPVPAGPDDRQEEAEAEAVLSLYESGEFQSAQLRHEAMIEKRTWTTPFPGVVASFVAEEMDPVLAMVGDVERRGLAAEAAGDLATTERLFSQVAAMVAVSRVRPDRIAAAESNVARILTLLGRHDEARGRFARALELSENLGAEDPVRTAVLRNFAHLMWTIADAEAPDPADGRFEELMGQVERPSDFTVRMRIRLPQQADGESEFAFTVRLLSARSAFYDSIHDTVRARRLLELALELRRVAARDDPTELAGALTALVEHDIRYGHHASADRGLTELLDLAGTGILDPSMELDLHLKRLELAFRLGQFERIQPLIEELRNFGASRDLSEQMRHLVEENVALTFLRLGDTSQALPVVRAILEREASGADGPESAVPPQRLAKLGTYAMAVGEFDTAEAWFGRALRTLRECEGEWNLEYALALSNKGTLARYRGRFAEAEQDHRRAAEIRVELLGADHPVSGESLIRHVLDLALLDRSAEALGVAINGLASARRQIGRVSMMSAEQALLSTIRRHRGWLDLGISLLARGQGEDAVAQLFDCVLRQKALSSLALITRRNAVLSGRHPQLAVRLAELHELQALLGSATLGGNEPPEVLAQARTRRDEIEVELARAIPEMSLESGEQSVTSADVAGALPAGSILAEFVQYTSQEFDQIAREPARDDISGPVRYALFLIGPGSLGAPRFLDIGAVEPIDAMVRSAVRALADGAAGPDPDDALVAAVCAPVIAFAAEAGAERIFLAPDGELSMLPFDGLPLAGGEPAVTAFEIIHLATGRDLLRQPLGDESTLSPPLIVFDPDYGKAETVGVAGDEKGGARGLKVRFERLPGTRREGASISARFPRARVLEGRGATREALMKVRRPLFLHLATHGFFLSGGGKLAALDPMLRSGLALAGANTSGEVTDSEPAAGLLTAAAVATLDLLGSDLVVLSACETGVGEARGGEGVFGLRRAFTVAGAQTVVMSLWSIPDDATEMLMRRFYEGLAAGKAKPAALRDAKLAMHGEQHPPRDWAGFISEGAWGPLRVWPQPDSVEADGKNS